MNAEKAPLEFSKPQNLLRPWFNHSLAVSPERPASSTLAACWGGAGSVNTREPAPGSQGNMNLTVSRLGPNPTSPN